MNILRWRGNTKKEGFVHVKVGKELLVGNRQKLRNKILDLLDGGHLNIRLDMSECHLIDSSGLGVLHCLSQEVDKRDGRLEIYHPTELVVAFLEQTRLGDDLTIIRSAA